MHSEPHGGASGLARALAAVGGIIAVLFTALFSLGSSLFVAVAIGVAGLIAKSRGRPLTRLSSWIVAVSSVGGLLLILGVVGITMLPDGTLDGIQQTADSASANATVPAWLERVAPGTREAVQKQSTPSGVQTAVNVWAAVVGVAIAWVILSCLFGSVGWAATMPLAFAVTGTWLSPPSAPASPPASPPAGPTL